MAYDAAAIEPRESDKDGLASKRVTRAADQKEDARPNTDEFRTRESIRDECRAKLKACAQDASSAMSARDVEEYMRMGLDEEALRSAKTEEEKTRWLREQRNTFVPDFIRQTKTAGTQLMSLMAKARSDKAISLENIAEWKRRMKSGRWEWKTRQRFIENQLPEFVFNWKVVAAKRRKILKEPGMAALKTAEILPAGLSKNDLQQFLSGTAFLNTDYERRKSLTQAVENALKTVGKVPSMETLKKDARGKLQAAAKAGGLAYGKIDGWMQRIFKRSWSPQRIKAFLTESSENDLSSLSKRWIKARERFDAFKKKCDEKGTPRNFHLVHLSVFLGWDYPQRTAYLDRAEQSFTLMEIAEKDSEEKVDGLKLDIGHALHMKDWNEAEDLLEKATKEFPQDPQIRALERDFHLRKPKRGSPAGQKNAKPSPEEAQKTMEDMRQHVRNMPVSMQKLAIRVLQHPDPTAFKRLRQLWYNRDWCRKHGYLDDERENEQAMSAQNKNLTRFRQEHGHGTGYEVNHIDGDTATKQAIRGRNRRPQVDYMGSDQQSIDATASVIIEKRNDEWFGYWTTLIPRDVSFGKHKEVLDNNLYPLLQGKRKLAAAGVQFSMNENDTVMPAMGKKSSAEPQHALAA
jgi:hypothetical protein